MGTITSINEFSGKLGNMVGFKKKDGTYGVRKHQRKPNNPRTTAQMAVRVSIANMVAFWKAMVAVSRPNFENKPAGDSDYNVFFQTNYGNNPVYLTKQDVRAGTCVAAPYMITRGTLPTIALTAVSGGKMKSDIALDDFTITTETTVGELAQAICGGAPERFKEGDMLSVIYVEQTEVSDPDNNVYIPRVVVKALRIPMDTSDQRLVADLENGDLVGVTDGYLSSKSTVNGGFTMVHSRLVEGKTAVSTQWFTVNNNILSLYTGSAARQKAMGSYGLGKALFFRPIVTVAEALPPEP